MPDSETYCIELDDFIIVWSLKVPFTIEFLWSLDAASIPELSLFGEIYAGVPLTIDSLCDPEVYLSLL